MKTTLDRLQDQLLDRLSDQGDGSMGTSIGIYHCRRPHSLRAVPIHQATLMLVVSGQKEAGIDGSRPLTIRRGELLIVPADTTLWVRNRPGGRPEEYLGIGMAFDPDTIRRFRDGYPGQPGEWETTPRPHATAPEAVIGALHQWLVWCRRYPVDALLRQHRQVELLLLLAQSGLAGNLLLREQPSWRQRVSRLLAEETSRDWRIRDVCERLCTSESSLRRRLQAERSSFRDLLEEVRMVAGLSLLLETSWPVGRVARQVGYQSESRFGERFRRRFGITPARLRRTRFAERGERSAVRGEQS